LLIGDQLSLSVVDVAPPNPARKWSSITLAITAIDNCHRSTAATVHVEPGSTDPLRKSKFLGVAGSDPRLPSTRSKCSGGVARPLSTSISALAIIPGSKISISGLVPASFMAAARCSTTLNGLA